MANTRTRINISGIPGLKRNIDKLKTDLFFALDEAVLAGSDIIRDDAKERARKKSGEMADGIVSTVTWYRKAPVAWAGAGMDASKTDIFAKISANGKRYYYPSSIEYGHPGAPAYPFMRPAMDANKAAVRKAVRDRIKRVIEEAKF